jgi:carboxypeptidase family protein/TonB-dependent receptor-like protein
MRFPNTLKRGTDLTLWWPVVLLVATVCSARPVWAQSTTGSISGGVSDTSSALLTGARVTVTSEETGATRTSATNARGRYHIFDLTPGSYRVRVEQPGFAPASREHVSVNMGTDVSVDLTMAVANVAEEVTVAGTSLDVRTSAQGGVVSQQQIEALPLNGRNFLQLGALQPGVVVSRASGREFTGGFGNTQLSMAGARPEHTGFLLDGTNIADISDKAPSSVGGVMLGVDAVREFSVQTHGYSAEFGRAAGGIVSAVTRSGTNQFHGSIFEFHRDDALDARGAFDPPDAPDFLRNQFGGSIGGPIRRNSLFFFGSYEGLRDRSVVTYSARLPNQAAHDGFLPDSTGALQPVTIEPDVRPYLDLLFPVPAGEDFGDGTAELRHSHQDPTNENFFVVKGDWNAGPRDTFMVRFSRDASNAVGSQEHPLFLEYSGTNTKYFTAQHEHVFGSSAVNSLRVAVNNPTRTDDVRATVDIPKSLYFTEDPHFGSITVIGLSPVGSTATIPADYDQHIYQVADTFTWNRGNHVWKTGLDWQRYHFDGSSYSRYGGEFRFRNLQEFLTLHRSAKAEADRFTGNMPGTDTVRHMRQDYVALFGQDDWHVRDGLTLSLGLRYDFVTTPTERNGLVAGLLSLDDLESGPRGVTPGSPLFDNPSKRSVAPRLGLSWAPGRDARTVVRAGYGLFYQPLTVSYYRGTIFRIYPWFAGVDIRQPAVFGPDIQDVLASGAAAQRRSEFIGYDAEQPFIQQWHASAERELGAGFTAEIGYLGSNGHHLPFYGDPNAVPSERLPDGSKRVIPGASLRYPSWGRIRTRINVAHSDGNALILGLRRRLTNGLALQGAYTYAHSNDTWSGGQMGTSDFDNGAGSATDWWDPEAELGPSNFDVRHTFIVNATYELPWGRSLGGVTGALARGWSVSGLAQLASGLPFTPFIGFDQAHDLQSDADTIQKPDLVGPVSYPHTRDAWFDVNAFGLPQPGYYGNSSRNLLRGPGLKLVDLAIMKTVDVASTKLQFRLEAFNLCNWVNLGLPNASVLFNEDGTYRAGAARITTTATSARQLQLGVKWLF